MRFLLLFLFLFIGAQSKAQSNEVTVSFKAVYGNKLLNLNEPFITEQKVIIDISTLKFYISNIELFFVHDQHKTSRPLKKEFYLIDFSKKEQAFTITTPEEFSYENIKFDLGIDSQSNVSGAIAGDLDPTNGMYWTWQSGYINFKLEGQAGNSSARKNEIIFHLGGYLHNQLAIQSVRLPINSTEKIEIILDLKPFIESLDFKKEYKLMSPGQRAVELSRIIAQSFLTQ